MVIKAGPSFSGGVQGRGRDRVTNPEDLGSTIMPPAIGVGPHERLFMRQNTNLNLYRAELSKIIGATKLTLGLTKSRAVVRGHFEANSKINAVDISCNVDDQGQFGAKAKVQNMLPGLAIQFSGGLQHSEGRPGRSAGFSADYTIEKPGFTGQLGFEQNRLVMSGMLGVRNALLGAATEFDSDSGAVAEPVLMARYNGDSFLLSASGRAGGDRAEVTLQQRISESLSAAAGVTINSITLGVQHDSDFALVRAKVESRTRLAAMSVQLKDFLPKLPPHMLHTVFQVDSTGPGLTLQAKFDA